MLIVREPLLHPTPIEDLRPTQITVGMREVEEKRRRWIGEIAAAPDLFRKAVAGLSPAQLDPFALAEAIDQQLDQLYALARPRAVSRPPAPRTPAMLSPASPRQEGRGRSRVSPRSAGARSASVPAAESQAARVTSQTARR